MAGAVVALVVAVAIAAWGLRERHKRRVRVREARREAFRIARDERAARAALRPYTDHVAAAPIHPPLNGGRRP